MHDNYSIDLRSIADINTHILEIEQSMDKVASNLHATIMDKDLRSYIPAKLKSLKSQLSRQSEDIAKLTSELAHSRQLQDSYDSRTRHVIHVLHHIASSFDHDLIGYVARVTCDVFSGRPESMMPVENM